MNDDMIPVLVIAGIATIVVAGIVMSLVNAKKRREALAALAASMGFTFTPKGSDNSRQLLGDFKLFNKGRAKRMTNIMSGVAQGIDVRIFDYRYTVGSGKNSHTYSQTVVAFESDALQLPGFALAPENLFHKIGAAFGMQDINFDSYPEFSRRYLLKGDDEESVRAAFPPIVLSFFEEHEKLSVEGHRQRLVVYRAGKTVRPDRWQEFMTECFGVFSVFRR